MRYPTTPDGRYFVVRGRLWRCTNPALDPAKKKTLTRELMDARRAKGSAMRTGDDGAREAARAKIDAAKIALGERGPPWWDDGAADVNRLMVSDTVYAQWWAGQADQDASVPAIKA